MKMIMFLKLLIYQMIRKIYSLRKSIFENAIKSPLFDRKKFSENFFNSLKEIIK